MLAWDNGWRHIGELVAFVRCEARKPTEPVTRFAARNARSERQAQDRAQDVAVN